MATAAVQHPQSAPSFTHQVLDTAAQTPPSESQDVKTTLNYYKPNADGSPPHPTYVGRPETYDRPIEPHTATIRDVRGQESAYTLDGNGFQFHKHSTTERDFKDDEQIKRAYYPEVEQLLKDV